MANYFDSKLQVTGPPLPRLTSVTLPPPPGDFLPEDRARLNFLPLNPELLRHRTILTVPIPGSFGSGRGNESWIRQTADAVPKNAGPEKRFTRKKESLQFRSMLAPPVPLIERIAAGDPTNPFCTPEYVSATESLGAQTCMIGLWEADEPATGCFGFLTGSFLRRSLSIPSLPGIPEQQVFWEGLLQLCRELKIWRLEIDTYGSPAVEVPQLQGELTRKNPLGVRPGSDLREYSGWRQLAPSSKYNSCHTGWPSGSANAERVCLRSTPGTHEIIDAATGRPWRGGRYRARQ